MRRTTLYKSFNEIEKLSQLELAALLEDISQYDVIMPNGTDKLKCSVMMNELIKKYNISMSICDFANLIFAEVCYRVMKNKIEKRKMNEQA